MVVVVTVATHVIRVIIHNQDFSGGGSGYGCYPRHPCRHLYS